MNHVVNDYTRDMGLIFEERRSPSKFMGCDLSRSQNDGSEFRNHNLGLILRNFRKRRYSNDIRKRELLDPYVWRECNQFSSVVMSTVGAYVSQPSHIVTNKIVVYVTASPNPLLLDSILFTDCNSRS